jgi:MFS family permease
MSPRLRQLTAPVTVLTHQGLAPRQMVLLLCGIMHAIHDGYTSAMYLLLPLIATDLQLSYAQVGFLKTLISGGQSLFQLPGGMVAERVGERRMLTLGLATLSYRRPGHSRRWRHSVCSSGSALACSTRCPHPWCREPMRPGVDAPRWAPTTSPGTSARSLFRRC